MEQQELSPEKLEATGYLASLLNKNLRIHTTDTRMFRGEFKCTDPDRNIVLAHTYEYRQPSRQKVAEQASGAAAAAAEATVKLELTSRYLGLVVVPGQYIVKIELEEFASQMR